MPDDTPRRRMTVDDLRPRKPSLDLTRQDPAREASRAAARPAAPQPTPRPAKPPEPPPRPTAEPAAEPARAKPTPPPPPCAPGEKTEAQRAKRRRYRAQRNRGALRTQADVLLVELQARYPVAFAPGWPRPLAIGVHHTIQADLGCDPKVLGLAMRIWCSQAGYLANVVDMGHRHGLDGSQGTELTAEEKAHAATRLDAVQAMFRERAKQRRETRTP